MSKTIDPTPKNKKTKKVKVKNPYTGEMEEVDITFYGDEFTDDVLKDKGMQAKIKEQFYNRKMEADRMHAEQTKMNQEEAQRARQELADSYKKAMEEINRRNGGNP